MGVRIGYYPILCLVRTEEVSEESMWLLRRWRRSYKAGELEGRKIEAAGCGRKAQEVEIGSCLPGALARHEAVPSDFERKQRKMDRWHNWSQGAMRSGEEQAGRVAQRLEAGCSCVVNLRSRSASVRGIWDLACFEASAHAHAHSRAQTLPPSAFLSPGNC
jgi:hypothetical protein